MGPKTGVRMAFNAHKNGRPGKDITVQQTGCEKTCRLTPSAKTVRRQLSRRYAAMGSTDVSNMWRRPKPALLLDQLNDGISSNTILHDSNESTGLRASVCNTLTVTTGPESLMKKRMDYVLLSLPKSHGYNLPTHASSFSSNTASTITKPSLASKPAKEQKRERCDALSVSTENDTQEQQCSKKQKMLLPFAETKSKEKTKRVSKQKTPVTKALLNGFEIITKITNNTTTTTKADPSTVSKPSEGPEEQLSDTSLFSNQNIDTKKKPRLKKQGVPYPCAEAVGVPTETKIKENTKKVRKQIINKKVLWKKTARNKLGKKCLGKLRTAIISRKGGIKKMRKEHLQLQMMMQCHAALKDSSSSSLSHIAQLLSLEIDKAKKGNEGPPPTVSSGEGQFSNDISGGGDTEKLQADDNKNKESSTKDSTTDLKVLEIEATFFMSSSTGEGNGKIRSISLPPPRYYPCLNKNGNYTTIERGILRGESQSEASSIPNIQPVTVEHTQVESHSLHTRNLQTLTNSPSSNATKINSCTISVSEGDETISNNNNNNLSDPQLDHSLPRPIISGPRSMSVHSPFPSPHSSDIHHLKSFPLASPCMSKKISQSSVPSSKQEELNSYHQHDIPKDPSSTMHHTTMSSPRGHHMVPQNDHVVEPHNLDGQAQRLNSDNEAQPRNLDSKAKSLNSYSQSESQLQNSDNQEKAHKSDIETQPQNLDTQTQPHNLNNKIHLQNSDDQIKPQNSDSQMQPENLDSHTQPQNSDSQIQPENSDIQTQSKNSDIQIQPQNLDTQAQPKNLDNQAQPQNSDSQTQLENSDSLAHRQNSDCQAKLNSSILEKAPNPGSTSSAPDKKRKRNLARKWALDVREPKISCIYCPQSKKRRKETSTSTTTTSPSTSTTFTSTTTSTLTVTTSTSTTTASPITTTTSASTTFISTITTSTSTTTSNFTNSFTPTTTTTTTTTTDIITSAVTTTTTSISIATPTTVKLKSKTLASSYNLRSVHISSTRSESRPVTFTTNTDTGSLHKRICPREVQVCLTKLEHQFPPLANYTTDNKHLPQHKKVTTGKHVSFPRSVMGLRSTVKNNTELQRHSNGSEKSVDAKSQLKEVDVSETSKRVCGKAGPVKLVRNESRKVSINPVKWELKSGKNRMVEGSEEKRGRTDEEVFQAVGSDKNIPRDKERNSCQASTQKSQIEGKKLKQTDKDNHVEGADNHSSSRVGEIYTVGCQALVGAAQSNKTVINVISQKSEGINSSVYKAKEGNFSNDNSKILVGSNAKESDIYKYHLLLNTDKTSERDLKDGQKFLSPNSRGKEDEQQCTQNIERGNKRAFTNAYKCGRQIRRINRGNFEPNRCEAKQVMPKVGVGVAECSVAKHSQVKKVIYVNTTTAGKNANKVADGCPVQAVGEGSDKGRGTEQKHHANMMIEHWKRDTLETVAAAVGNNEVKEAEKCRILIIVGKDSNNGGGGTNRNTCKMIVRETQDSMKEKNVEDCQETAEVNKQAKEDEEINVDGQKAVKAGVNVVMSGSESPSALEVHNGVKMTGVQSCIEMNVGADGSERADAWKKVKKMMAVLVDGNDSEKAKNDDGTPNMIQSDDKRDKAGCKTLMKKEAIDGVDSSSADKTKTDVGTLKVKQTDDGREETGTETMVKKAFGVDSSSAEELKDYNGGMLKVIKTDDEREKKGAKTMVKKKAFGVVDGSSTEEQDDDGLLKMMHTDDGGEKRGAKTMVKKKEAFGVVDGSSTEKQDDDGILEIMQTDDGGEKRGAKTMVKKKAFDVVGRSAEDPKYNDYGSLIGTDHGRDKTDEEMSSTVSVSSSSDESEYGGLLLRLLESDNESGEKSEVPDETDSSDSEADDDDDDDYYKSLLFEKVNEGNEGRDNTKEPKIMSMMRGVGDGSEGTSGGGNNLELNGAQNNNDTTDDNGSSAENTDGSNSQKTELASIVNTSIEKSKNIGKHNKDSQKINHTNDGNAEISIAMVGPFSNNNNTMEDRGHATVHEKNVAVDLTREKTNTEVCLNTARGGGGGDDDMMRMNGKDSLKMLGNKDTGCCVSNTLTVQNISVLERRGNIDQQPNTPSPPPLPPPSPPPATDHVQMMDNGDPMSEETGAEFSFKTFNTNGTIEQIDSGNIQEGAEKSNPNNLEINTHACQMMVTCDSVMEEMTTNSRQTMPSADILSGRASYVKNNVKEEVNDSSQTTIILDTSGNCTEQRAFIKSNRMKDTNDTTVEESSSEVYQVVTSNGMSLVVREMEQTTQANVSVIETCHMQVKAILSHGREHIDSCNERASGGIIHCDGGTQTIQGRTAVEDGLEIMGGECDLTGAYEEMFKLDDNYSLNNLMNENSYYDVQNIEFSHGGKDSFLNFETKTREKSWISEQSDIDSPPEVRMLMTPEPAWQPLLEGSGKPLSTSINDENVKVLVSALSGQSEEPALKHTSHHAKEEGSVVIPYVYQIPNEAQLFEELENHLMDSQDWDVQDDTNNSASNASKEEDFVNEGPAEHQSCAGEASASSKEDHVLHTSPQQPTLGDIKSSPASLPPVTEELKTFDNEVMGGVDEDVLSIYTSADSLIGDDITGEEDEPFQPANWNTLSGDNRILSLEYYSEGRNKASRKDGTATRSHQAFHCNVTGNTTGEASTKDIFRCFSPLDTLEAVPKTEEPLSLASSSQGSIISESTVIKSIIEEDARCTLIEELEDEDDGNITTETIINADNKVSEATLLPNNPHVLVSRVKGMETQSQTDSVGFRKISPVKSVQERLVALSIKWTSKDNNKLADNPNGIPFKAQESAKNSTLLQPAIETTMPATAAQQLPPPLPPGMGEASNDWRMLSSPVEQLPSGQPQQSTHFGTDVFSSSIEGMAQEANQGALPIITIPPPHLPPQQHLLGKRIPVPRPPLPQKLCVCYNFLNRGFCTRTDCIYGHEINSHCELYLGQLVLHHVTTEREEQAWSLLDRHLSYYGYPIQLAVTFLRPFAHYLLMNSHNKHCTSIKVPSSFVPPLDVAKLSLLCEMGQAKGAFNILCARHAVAYEDELNMLLCIFVRFCEKFFLERLLSPWEKVCLWNLNEDVSSDCESRLQELLGMEWLRIHMDLNAKKVWEVYKHLTKFLTAPSDFFTDITCEVIYFFRNQGRPQDSFRVLEEVWRLKATSRAIYKALIPKKKQNVVAVANELKMLSRLVCELKVNMYAISWELLLSHMMDLKDLHLTMKILRTQASFMTPKRSILQRLLEECKNEDMSSYLKPLGQLMSVLPKDSLAFMSSSVRRTVNQYQPEPCNSLQPLFSQQGGRFGMNVEANSSAQSVVVAMNQPEPSQPRYDAPPLDIIYEGVCDGNMNTSGTNGIANTDTYNNKNQESSCIYNESSSSNSNNSMANYTMINTTNSNEGNEYEVEYGNNHSEGSGGGDAELAEGVFEQGEISLLPTPTSLQQGEISLLPTPTSLQQGEMSLLPTPTSLPSSGVIELVSDQPKKTTTTIPARPADPTNKEMTAEGHHHYQHPQQPRSSVFGHQHPFTKLLQTSTIEDKAFPNTGLKSHGFDMKDILLTPDSTSTIHSSHKQAMERGANGEYGGVPESRPFLPKFNVGLSITREENSSDEAEPDRKDSRPVREADPNNKWFVDVQIPEFRVVKVKNKTLPKVLPNKILGSDVSKEEPNASVPPDTLAPIDTDWSASRKTEVLSLTDKQDSSAIPPLQKGSTRIGNTQLNHKQDNSCAQHSQWDSFPPINQHQWVYQDNSKPQNSSGQSSLTISSSPSYSSESFESSMQNSASQKSSKVSHSAIGQRCLAERSGLLLVDTLEHLQIIATLKTPQEKQQQLAEIVTTLTDGYDIFHSGTKICAILKACGESGPMSAEEREVVEALALKVLIVCSQKRISRQAEIVILAIHQHKLSFFNSLVVCDGDSYSEQQLAVLALRVLQQTRNVKLFVDVLEDTCWSGSRADVIARLELLSQVLEEQLESGFANDVMWCTGRILASLVTYYHQDIQTLHDYEAHIDLPSWMEAVWNWIGISGNEEILEQITVTVRTALRLNVPLSQYFLSKLREKGVLLGNIDTLVAAQSPSRTLQLQTKSEGPCGTSQAQTKSPQAPSWTSQTQTKPPQAPSWTSQTQAKPPQGPNTTLQAQIKPQQGPNTTLQAQTKPQQSSSKIPALQGQNKPWGLIMSLRAQSKQRGRGSQRKGNVSRQLKDTERNYNTNRPTFRDSYRNVRRRGNLMGGHNAFRGK